MAIKDFTAWATPALQLKHADKIYSVEPPTTGEVPPQLAASQLPTTVLPLLGRVAPDVWPEVFRDLVAATDGRTIEDLGLPQHVREQMDADGVPAETIRRLATYAVLFHSLGEERADARAEAAWAAPSGEAEAPKKRGRKKTTSTD